jgi:4-diphosphocytidyl-2-C-methyl-D-erythritol kinase
MIVFPNAKINLGLNILEKRTDNFHNLESVFYPIGWSDALEILPAEDFNFQSSGITIDGDQSTNLCVKVYQALRDKYSLPPVSIHLHKNIPIGAGLGGGSSDAAFTLKLLNQLFHLNLSVVEMQNFIRPFGSDCAFFIENKPVFAFGKGDQFEETGIHLTGKHIILIYPNIHVSTKEAYEGIVPEIQEKQLKLNIEKEIYTWKNSIKNDFEKGIFKKYPAISKWKEEFYKMGALYASMSGSGSTVFGIFEEEVKMNGLVPSDYKVWSGTLS